MPNYKIFQDNPDQALIKIFGSDSTGTAQSLLTSTSGTLSTSGIVAVSGGVSVSGTVGVSGPVEISGSVAISGGVSVSGTVGVSGPVEISGSVAISGGVTVGVSGPVEISGSVAVSGGVSVSGTVGVSGPVQVSGTVALSGHSIVDSGPLTASVTPTSSGEVSGAFDVLSYTSWTLAVEYSGSSGAGVSVILQKSAVSGGVASGGDWIYDSSGTFTSANWLFLTAGVTPRYARLYYVNTGTGSGTLYQTFQAQN